MTTQLTDTRSTILIQYLTERLESMAQDIQQIKQDNQIVKQQLEFIIKNIVTDISSIKSENREIDEKILLIEDKTTALLQVDQGFAGSRTSFERILVKTILPWHDLDDDTRTYLISGEYLYSSLQKSDIDEFSPCVLQFCKALEHQLFLRFFKDFIEMMNTKENIKTALIADISNDETRVFAYQCVSGTNYVSLTLGNMAYILKRLKLAERSYLMKEYQNYLNDKNLTQYINKELIGKLFTIVELFRNRSAHPEILTLDQAKEAKKIIPEVLNSIF